jgi:two-component system LytT family response regulator
MSEKIRTLIIENEIAFLKSFQKMLLDFSNVEILDSCSDVQTAHLYITKYKPDLVFLDIELNGGNAFDLLSKFDTIDFEVVFTTAFNQYAINAIKMSALDYILKPFGKNEIELALSKLIKKNKSETSVQHLISNLNKSHEQDKSIALHTNDGISFLTLSEIIYCKADSNYTIFHTTTANEHMVSIPLKKFDDMLSDKFFFRVHQSYLINLKYLKKFSKNNGGEVVMNNGAVITVARRKKEELLQALSSISI